MSGAEHDASLAPGFHALEVVHRGTASTVYRALRDGTGAPAALKVMRDAEGETEIRRLRELARLPGIVGVLGRGRTSSGRGFVAMDYCEGGDYAADLRRRHPLPVEEVVRAGRSAAAALHAVHALGLLHHRVEPANMLRSAHGPVLADAGGVLPAADRPPVPAPDAQAVVHAPPEAVRGEPATPASDVYRLASALWTLLAGHPPFAAGPGAAVDPFDYRDRILTADPPRIPRSDLPGALRPVLARALARNPAERYTAAADFAAALDGAFPLPEEAAAPPPAAAFGGGTRGAPPAETGPEPTAGDDHGAPGREHGEEAAAGTARPGDDASRGRSTGEHILPPTGEDTAQLTHAVHGTTDALRGAGGGLDAPSGAETASAPAARPEDAWAGLAGWTGTGGLHPDAPGADSGSAPADDASEGGAPHSPGEASLREATAADRAPAPTFAPAPPLAPEPPAAEPARPIRRRPLYIAAAVAAIGAVVVTAGAVALLRPGLGGELMGQTGEQQPTAGASGSAEGRGSPPAPPAATVRAAAPTDVTLDDGGDTAVVGWSDGSGGQASHYVVGGPVGTTPANLADAEPGETEVEVSGLNATQEYCFTVVAVLSVDEIARSEEVCTDRGTG